jgi:hypothetical protein
VALSNNEYEKHREVAPRLPGRTLHDRALPATFGRSNERARTAQRLVEWFSARPFIGLDVCLIALPNAARGQNLGQNHLFKLPLPRVVASALRAFALCLRAVVRALGLNLSCTHHAFMPTLIASGRRWNGVVAQLVERLVRNEKVRGSTPLGSTTQ